MQIVLEVVFNDKYWELILLFSLLLAAGVTWMMYFKSRDAKELNMNQIISLALLRFITVFTVTFFLSGPLLKSLRRMIQQPVVIVAFDNSASVTAFSTGDGNGISELELIESIRSGLSGQFEVISYSFDEKAIRNETPDFKGKGSAYGQMIQTVYNNHFNDNIGALVVIGDGIYNRGENPLNVARQLNFPVYTLGLGDTTAYRDAGITAIRTNKNAFAGNKFPVEVDIRYQGMPGQNLKFSIIHNGETIFTENIYTRDSEGFRTLSTYIDAGSSGLQYFTARIETNLDERNMINNSQRFVINILENKQRILIISNGVHPDAGAIKNALESQVNYDVSLFTSEPYPADIKQFNLAIFCQVPSAAQSGRVLFEQAESLRIPKLVLLGSQSHIPQFNLQVQGAGIVLQAGNMEDAQPALNKDFATFTLSENLVGNIEKFPPLKVPFGRYQLDGVWNILSYQRIRNIITDRPLIAVSNRNGVKTGVVFGEGIWRWRMYNYLSDDSHAGFNELIDKLVQYLATRDNEDNFIIGYKPVYQETESVIMTAEVYNDSYEPVTTPEVSMVLRDSTNQEYIFLFDRGNQFYRLDAGVLPPGDYSFDAKVELGGVTYTESGNFAVMPVDIEMMDTEANHRLLFQLARQTGGEFFYPEESASLLRSISENSSIRPFTYYQMLLNELLNLKWLFFIIIALLSLEWFLRKFWGIY